MHTREKSEHAEHSARENFVETFEKAPGESPHIDVCRHACPQQMSGRRRWESLAPPLLPAPNGRRARADPCAQSIHPSNAGPLSERADQDNDGAQIYSTIKEQKRRRFLPFATTFLAAA